MSSHDVHQPNSEIKSRAERFDYERLKQLEVKGLEDYRQMREARNKKSFLREDF